MGCAPAPLVTTQSTGKPLKAQMLLSAMMMCAGVAWGAFVVQVHPSRDPVSSLIGALLLFSLGFIWFVVTRIKIWWEHE